MSVLPTKIIKFADTGKFLKLKTSFCPVASVQVAVADGLGDVHGLYVLAAVEVGDGAGDLRLRL